MWLFRSFSKSARSQHLLAPPDPSLVIRTTAQSEVTLEFSGAGLFVWIGTHSAKVHTHTYMISVGKDFPSYLLHDKLVCVLSVFLCLLFVVCVCCPDNFYCTFIIKMVKIKEVSGKVRNTPLT